jgi:hypothetical protein
MRLRPRLCSNPRVVRSPITPSDPPSPHDPCSPLIPPPARRAQTVTARPPQPLLPPPARRAQIRRASELPATPIGATCGHGHRRGPSGHGQGRAQPRRLGGRGLSGGRAGTTKGGRGLADSGRAGAAAPGEHNDAGSPAVGRARRGSGRARVTGGGGGQGRAQPRRLGGRGLSGGRAGTTKGGRGLADSGRAGAAAPGEHNDAGSPAVGRARRGSGRARVTGGGGGGNSPSTPARLRVGERSSGRARQREGSPAVERARGHRRRRTDCYWHQGTTMNCPQVCPINHPANSTLFSFLILC